MLFMFDLWKYDDVAKHAQAILDQVKSGAMPCDEAWSKERVAVFARWVEAGRGRVTGGGTLEYDDAP